MDLNRKVEIAKTAIDSITRHDDEDLAVRKQAAALIFTHINAEIDAAEKRVAARVGEVFGQKPGA